MCEGARLHYPFRLMHIHDPRSDAWKQLPGPAAFALGNWMLLCPKWLLLNHALSIRKIIIKRIKNPFVLPGDAHSMCVSALTNPWCDQTPERPSPCAHLEGEPWGLFSFSCSHPVSLAVASQICTESRIILFFPLLIRTPFRACVLLDRVRGAEGPLCVSQVNLLRPNHLNRL